MQEHTTHKGRLPDAGLCEGSDFKKKEGVKVLTPDGVGKMAKALRKRLATASDDGAVVRVRRKYFNRHLLGCEMQGTAGLVNVRVRDAELYRMGEDVAVKKNDRGEWEAATQRLVSRWGGKMEGGAPCN